MRACPLLLAVIAVSSCMAGCGSGDSGGSRAPVITDAGHGIAVQIPAGWHLMRSPATSLAYPDDRLLLTSYPARAGGRCGPDRAEAEMPAGGALVFLFEYRPAVGDVWSHLARAQFAPRPRRWSLTARNLHQTECWRVPSHVVLFRAADRPFQLQVAFGRRAGAARRAQVQRILRSLRFATLPAPPHDPYAGWPTRHDETGDTIRTPPHWPTLVTYEPRIHHQPRVLFTSANVQTPLLSGTHITHRFPAHALDKLPARAVVLRVIEERPGPASPAFPPFPHHAWPATTDFDTVTDGPAVRWPKLVWQRAGAERQRTRFSVWIVSGSKSSAADRAAARSAALSMGLSVGAFRNRRRRLTAAAVEHALRTNPHNEASAASCLHTGPSRFVCRIAFPREPGATFDLQVVSGHCFVAERRRPGRADYGCL